MKDYARQKCQLQHSTKKLSEVCAQEHKQNARVLNMRNILKEDIKKIQTEAGPHNDMVSTQQHRKKF